MDHADIVVIGGGCIGTSIAMHLAKQHTGTILLLEAVTLASGATGRSSALIRQHYTHPALITMARESLYVFLDFEAIIGRTADFRPTGFMVLVGPDDVDALKRNIELQKSLGVDTQFMTPEDVHHFDPRIAVSDVAGAAYEPESGYADPYSATVSYARAAQELGTDIRLGTRVERIETTGNGIIDVHTIAGIIRTEMIVVAAGYRSAELIKPYWSDIPVRPIRHSIAMFERPQTFGSSHCAISDRIQNVYLRPEGQDLTLVGSTDPLDGLTDTAIERDRPVSEATTARFGARFSHRFRTIDDFRVRRGYTGVYDVTSDGQPILGKLPDVEGMYLAFGFSGHGFKISPIIGSLMAGVMSGDEAARSQIEVFRPSRFAEGKPITAQHPYLHRSTGST